MVTHLKPQDVVVALWLASRGEDPWDYKALAKALSISASAPPLADALSVGAEDAVVWPTPDGPVRGKALTPLYGSVPAAALADPAFHEVLALADALRVGRSRERRLAAEALAGLLA